MFENPKQKQILSCMTDVLNQNGFRAQLMDATETNLMMMRAETQRLGKIGKEAVIDLCFIPVQLPGEDEGLLQFYVTIFSELPEMYKRNIREAVNYCNDYCMLGSFGYFEPAGQVFLKYSFLLDGSATLEKNVQLIADNIALLQASVGRFIDAFAAAGFSGTPIESLIDMDLLPKM